MISFRTQSRRDLFIHWGIMFCIVAIIFLGFFFIYLPASTHKGESITVPNLSGMKLDELKSFLEERDLRYEISDSTFIVGKPPLTVITQYPKEGAKVKPGRKVYLTVTAFNPPKVKMPKLVDLSLKSAEVTLQSYDLVLGQITYKPDLAENTVLEQSWEGKPVLPGTDIPKGSKIDLLISDARGTAEFPIPNLLGSSLEEASFTLKASKLVLGATIQEYREDKPIGKIFRQNPPAVEGNKVRLGDIIDVWINVRKEDTQPKEEGGEGKLPGGE
jgi:eukaryotic-like serine/threonine-protein kinase